jgi:hypothetical protein
VPVEDAALRPRKTSSRSSIHSNKLSA